MSEPQRNRVSAWLIAWRWPLLALGAALTVASYLPAQKLDFDRSIENMFAPDDPLLEPYAQLKRTFGGNEVVVAAYVDENLTTPAGVKRVDELTQAVEGVPGVAGVVSLTSTPLGLRIFEDRLLGPEFLELFEGYALGADRKTAAVVCMLESEVDSDARAETVRALRQTVERHDPSGVLAGEPVMVTEGFRAIQEDGRRLGLVSTLLLMATIVFCFRSLRWVLVPLAVVNATLLWTEASLVVSTIRLSMVSSMLWAIVTVVGIATVIHIVIRYREACGEGRAPRAALGVALAALWVPVTWTCCTDAAGFSSLLAAHVGPVRDFGIMMAAGSLLALLSLALLLPGLALWGRFDTEPQHAWGEAALDAALRRTINAVGRYPLPIAAAALALVAAAAFGCFRLEVETDFTRNFRDSSSVVKSYAFVESRLGGAGVWDVVVPAPKELTPAFVDRLRRLEQRLRDEVRVVDEDGATRPGLTKVISLAASLDAAPEIEVPFVTPEFIFQQKLAALRREMPVVAQALHGEDPQQPGKFYARLMLRSLERQSSAQKKKLIADVTRISREEFPGGDGEPPAQVTGFFVLLASLIDSMIADQWVAFGIAIGAIGLMMLVAFRSPVLAVVALVPNIGPILIITGAMGWLELKINMGAAMIAAVSMGLAVDSSIHYITAFRRLRRGGSSVSHALHRVQQTVGRAATFSTLALIVGFSALCFSEFVPTIYFGVLVSLAMLGGLLGNLVILPLLLQLVTREKRTGSDPA